MMMMHKQDFRVQKIFPKPEQSAGYQRLIPLQNVPIFDVAGILVPPVLAVLNTCIKNLEKQLRNPGELHHRCLLNASSKLVGNLFLR